MDRLLRLARLTELALLNSANAGGRSPTPFTQASPLGPGQSYTMQRADGVLYVAAGALPVLPANPVVDLEYLIKVVVGVAETTPVLVSAGGTYLLEDPGAPAVYTFDSRGAIKVSATCNGWTFDGTRMNLTR